MMRRFGRTDFLVCFVDRSNNLYDHPRTTHDGVVSYIAERSRCARVKTGFSGESGAIRPFLNQIRNTGTLERPKAPEHSRRTAINDRRVK